MFRPGDDLLSAQYGEGESEALQTDIQRFMAILGFCLMAVFALVQAIPMTSPKKDTVIEDLQQKLAAQDRVIERLREENGRLKGEAERLMRVPEKAASLSRELARAAAELDRQRREIEGLKARQAGREKDLVVLKREMERRDRKIRTLEAAKRTVDRLLAEAARALKVSRPAPVKKTPPPRKRGLYVAFESNRAFLSLLRAGRIQLLIRIVGMDRGFRAIPADGGFNFRGGGLAPGLDAWEVKESMVPPVILEGFRKWTSLASRKKMLIVGLSPEISRRIRGRGVGSGRFIIRADGTVSYSPPESG